MEIKVKIWIEDNKQNLIFGSGKTEILKEIEKQVQLVMLQKI